MQQAVITFFRDIQKKILSTSICEHINVNLSKMRPAAESLELIKYCNRWVRFEVLDVRLYIGPRVDLRVLQGFTITGGN